MFYKLFVSNSKLLVFTFLINSPFVHGFFENTYIYTNKKHLKSVDAGWTLSVFKQAEERKVHVWINLHSSFCLDLLYAISDSNSFAFRLVTLYVIKAEMSSFLMIFSIFFEELLFQVWHIPFYGVFHFSSWLLTVSDFIKWYLISTVE